MTSKRKLKNRPKRVTKRDLETVREVIYAPIPEPAEDPRKAVIEARARLMGVNVSDDLLSVLCGDPAGRAIHIGARDKSEAQKLWDLFARFDGADETYFRRIIGRPRFPNVAKLEMMPEPFETRPDDAQDYRDEAQKDRDAINRWMRWQGVLGCMSAPERSIVIRAARRCAGDLQREGVLTTTGAAFVAAMRVMRTVEEKS